LLCSVTSSMIMNFLAMHQKYGHLHQYVQKMVTATVNTNVAKGRQDATTKLDYWSSILLSEIQTNNNGHNNNPPIPNMGIADQLTANTEKLSRMHRKQLQSDAKME
jgi:hypothetical protein